MSVTDTHVIGDYTAAITIDGSTHYLLIQPGNSSTAYKKINRNVFLAISGNPLGTTDSQSVTNKTLDNSNVVTFRDDRFTLQDNVDHTKQAVFQLSGITTATTRTYTLPNASSTLVDISTSQTLTNKTLTSPVITSGSIDNSTITVDSIAGHTDSDSGTVYGISVTNGAMTSNSAIGDGIIFPKSLQSGTGSTWSLSSWTPTITLNGGGSNGNATITGKYIQMGKFVFFTLKYVIGSTTSFAGLTNFYSSLPVTASSTFADTATGNWCSGIAIVSGAAYSLGALTNSSTQINIVAQNATGSYITATSITATIPAGWSNGDNLFISGRYEAA